MNPEVFREYDIRGIAGEDMTETDVLLLGRAIGTFMRQHGRSELAVGRDCRLTSDAYSEQLIRGLLLTGCHVTDIGLCPTPVLYFAIQHLSLEGGVMVTASHNPKEYNGFKMCIGPDSVHGEDIQEIREIVEQQAFETGEGTRASRGIIPEYQKQIAENITISKPMRVGIDAGNGTAGEIARQLLEELGCEVHALYCEPDGNFPNHEADPTVLKNMADLIAMVREKGLDVGIGYDGDGDRIGVVDDRGEIVFGDKLIILFAREILSRKPGATFISEVKCSKVMYDDIEKHGGRAIMWKTGHSLIKAKMRAENAALAGEMSGHMFFEDRYLGYDDALYASCRLLEILADSGQRIADLLDDVPKTFTTPEIRVDCPDDRKFGIVAKVTDYFRERFDVIDIDGVRVLFDDGWGLVRASNTQPALVLRFEAMTEARLAEIRTLVESVLKEIRDHVG
ncbi:phosphomannomutase/phosphoglucomutase [Desulfonema ishimotonii]|uniref:Phosphomannomutase/phosphoglucomutase n=1 Tax=Desulfonema ishimotonii TaxID=45657 RepID=A0A401G272_9BACT|nr:phosphomannomutase/phosphoglucomutase [Desulfonema ishimotonii]GBC63329.1 phosphomannomutase/phosphoglucomutase [Desulfonema ishimotonii]